MAKRLKTGGRELGTLNKLTSELKERINDFLDDNWMQVKKDFKTLDPEKRIAMFEKLLQYSLPKMQTTKIDAEINSHPTILYQNVSKQFPDN